MASPETAGTVAPCRKCKGTGAQRRLPCQTCEGKGRVLLVPGEGGRVEVRTIDGKVTR